MTSFWLIFFFINGFFIFRLKSVICKKYTNANGRDIKYTNAIDIISLYYRLHWWQFCRLYWKLFCRMFFVTQFVFFSLFHMCSKFMALSDESRMFFSCYFFFSFSGIFYLTQNLRGNSFRIYRHACFDFFKKFLATTNS